MNEKADEISKLQSLINVADWVVITFSYVDAEQEGQLSQQFAVNARGYKGQRRWVKINDEAEEKRTHADLIVEHECVFSPDMYQKNNLLPGEVENIEGMFAKIQEWNAQGKKVQLSFRSRLPGSDSSQYGTSSYTFSGDGDDFRFESHARWRMRAFFGF